jgi:glycosyltransferase involved in cell wall biosynthesis
MSRAEVFSTIFARFSSQIGSLADPTKQIIISQTDEGADNVVKHPLSPDQYLAAIAGADFFICPPGWSMPHSHNLVEAMSVGTIPITNYNDYIAPALVNNVNSLQFHDAESLSEAIDTALNMPAHHVREMREQALLYYDEVLSHLAVGTKIRQSLLTLDKIIANSERLFDLFPKASTV